MNRLKVLASAYACNPTGSLQLHPGEDMTGWRLVEQLRRFHEVWVITHSYNEVGIRAALAEIPLNGIHFHFVRLPSWLDLLYRVEFGKRIYYYLWQRKAWKVARKLHEEVRFDLAHHLTFGNDWMPSFIGAFLPIPFIWGPVGGGQRTPRGLLKCYALKGRIAEGFRDRAQWIGRNLLFSRRRCVKKARAILVCNDETKARISEPFSDKVHLFPVNGISEEDLSRDPIPGKEGDSFLVLTAGRLHRLKGFGLAIRAFDRFAEQFPEAVLTIVGEGPEEDRLKDLVETLSTRKKIRFVPWLPRKALIVQMRQSDVFLFPSFRDGGGAVVVEAMASGLPVICLDTGGPGFHVREQWGLKISPLSPEYVISEMAQGLKKLFLDRGLRESMGRAARERAETYYLWDQLGEEMLRIYEKVLSPGLGQGVREAGSGGLS